MVGFLYLERDVKSIAKIPFCDHNNMLKGTWIRFQFLFLMETSILYAKITVSQIFFFQNRVLNII